MVAMTIRPLSERFSSDLLKSTRPCTLALYIGLESASRSAKAQKWGTYDLDTGLSCGCSSLAWTEPASV